MKTIAVTILAALTAVSANAGGLVSPAPEPTILPPAPAAVSDWTGGYVGAQLGYGAVDSGGAGLGGGGALGGVHAGYRYDFGRNVAGIELDYDVADGDLGNGAG